MPSSSSSSSSSSTGVGSTGVGTGTTSGSGALGGDTGGTQHVDVPGIESAATRFTGFTESLDAVRTRMMTTAQVVPTKGGVDTAWTQFQAGGYADGTQQLTDAVYSVSRMIQGLHDDLKIAAQKLQQGEDDNTQATARLKESMHPAVARVETGGAMQSELGTPTATPSATDAVPASRRLDAHLQAVEAAVAPRATADGRAGAAAS